MEHLPLTLFISLLTTTLMVVISAIIYFRERDKRQWIGLEYWLSLLSYFALSGICIGGSSVVQSIPTVLWVWRMKAIKNILESVGKESLRRRWHTVILFLAYALSVVFAISHFDFPWYTFPQALAYFIVIMHSLKVTIKAMGLKKVSINHWILFATIFIIILHTLDFPFARQGPLVSIGFTIVLLTCILMAIVLPSVTIYELKQEQQEKLQKLLFEREELLKSQAKLSSLGEMTANIAHEINNPLGVILHRSSHLKTQIQNNAADKEMLMRNLDYIQSSTEHIGKIVRGLRTFMKGGSREPMQMVQFQSILEDTLSYCRDRFRINDILLYVDDIPDRTVECRPSQYNQVILNVLNNAFDAVVHTPHPWVRISFSEGSEFLKVVVADSGRGIPESIQLHMMEPFFTTKARAGTGLGLSISKGIMEEHHGRIYYDTTSINTAFVIEIPYRQSYSI